MHLVIDDKIPYMRGNAERLGTVTYLPGAAISKSDLMEADILIVRTRTRVNRALLEGTKVRYVATATIGFDHIDTAYLKDAGIRWTNCPGCNARSVRQYIKSVLLLLSYHRAFHLGEQITPLTEAVNEVELSFKNLTIGIVGVGYVGREVESLARELGFGRILLCDPPRAEREGSKAFCSLKDITAQADVITLHLPLTREGTPHPTYHLIDEEVFQTIRPQTVLINSGRGETVDNSALHHALVTGRLRAAVIDTWENEPAIDRKLLDSVFIATPHIAGYSADGKACGTRMALLAVARHFGLPETPFLKIVPPEVPAEYAYYPQGTARHLSTALRYYDPTRDDLALRSCPENFERLRGDYPLRREEP